MRANQLRIEIVGLIKGFNALFNPRVPHVHLNPLYQGVPELDPTRGGTLIGSSRDFVDPSKKDDLDLVAHRLGQLGIEGLICIGGDGTLNGLPDIILVPEHPLDLEHLVERFKQLYDLQKNVVIGDRYFQLYRRGDSAREAIFTRPLHAALYDPKLMKTSRLGIDYLLPIFTDAIGDDDAEHMRRALFAAGNLAQPYHSINTDVNKRIRYLTSAQAAESVPPMS